MCSTSSGAQVHQNARKDGERDDPKDPVSDATACNADDALALAAFEQRDDDDECPEAKQQEQAGPRDLAFPQKNRRKLARYLLRALLIIIEDGPAFAWLLQRVSARN